MDLRLASAMSGLRPLPPITVGFVLLCPAHGRRTGVDSRLFAGVGDGAGVTLLPRVVGAGFVAGAGVAVRFSIMRVVLFFAAAGVAAFLSVCFSAVFGGVGAGVAGGVFFSIGVAAGLSVD